MLYGVNSGYICGWNVLVPCICVVKPVKSAIAGGLKSKSFSEKLESIEADLVRSIVSEYVADVGNECDNPGGVWTLGVMM